MCKKIDKIMLITASKTKKAKNIHLICGQVQHSFTVKMIKWSVIIRERKFRHIEREILVCSKIFKRLWDSEEIEA